MNFNSILDQFNIIVIFQGFLLGIALCVMRKGDRLLNRLLGIMLLTFSWSGLYYSIDRMGKMEDYTSIAYTNAISDFVYNPLIYLYVCRLTIKDFKLSRKSILHFLPAIFMLAYYSNYYFSGTATKHEIFTRGYNYFPWDVMVLLIQIYYR